MPFTRWHAAIGIESKEEEVLFDALDRTWITIHGPMKVLYTDGESGFNSDSAKAWFKRKGIELVTRAPNQHARFIERRGAILRHAMHTTEEQLIREGIEVRFTTLLADSVFAGNAMTFVGGVSPYNAVYGRQPRMLPDLQLPGDDDHGETLDGRRERRVREVALQNMIGATSTARVGRALKTRTTPSGAGLYNEGDLVDYHRREGPTDQSGWHGPVPVSRNLPEQGQVLVKLNGRDRPCRLQDVRHTLLVFMTLLSGYLATTTDNAEHTVRDAIAALSVGAVKLFGMAKDKTNQWTVSKASTSHAQLSLALMHVCTVSLQLENVSAVRISRGTKFLHAVSGYASSVVVWWHPTHPESKTVYESTSSYINCQEIIGEDYPSVYIMQALMTTDADADADYELAHAHHHERALDVIPTPTTNDDERNDDHDEGPTVQEFDIASARLSTIPEGSQEDLVSERSFQAFLRSYPEASSEDIHHLEEAWAAIILHDAEEESLAKECKALEALPYPVSADPMYLYTNEASDPAFDEYAHYALAGIDPDQLYGVPDDTDQNGTPCVCMYFARHMCKVIVDDEHMANDEWVALQVPTVGSKQAVIQRQTDLLTKDEFHQHEQEVPAAILEELRIWVKHNCFGRAPRKGAKNILDSRFVGKWKIIKIPSQPDRRIIRMRMAVRGFKDWEADTIESYAGTASRTSQKVISSEVACHEGWSYITVDIEKAFLQGMTYKEISDLTGEAERIVHFTLPPGSAVILRRIPGFEDFGERYEVLGCTKPGTGTKDAPRAFSLKLRSITQDDE